MLREGEYLVDDAARIVVPLAYRGELQRGFHLTRGWHGSLFLFSLEEWLKIERRLKRARLTDLNAVAVQRFFAGGLEGQLDKQGRITLPLGLRRDHAKIGGSCVIIKNFGRIEIWNPARWLEYSETELTQEKLAEVANAMGI